MKKFIQLAALFAIAALGYSTPTLAVQDVAATKHNMSSTGAATDITTADTAFVCGFCHSPHTEASGPAPLWNRGDSVAGYTMYNSAISPTMDMVVAATPASISLACLSCHDGTVAFDQLINGAGSGNYNAAGASQGWSFTQNAAAVPNTMQNTSTAYIGTVLTGDHPISVTYNPALDNAFQPLATVQLSTAVQLYGAGEDQVECASCHDPHEATNPTFLRSGIDTMCTVCHIK